MLTKKILGAGVIGLLQLLSAGLALAEDYPTKFSNTGSIYNTRHNLTQRNADGSAITGPNGTLQSVFMDNVRNDYREVCVYCHTPHGSNANVQLPLWNRTIKATTYTTYNQLGTSSLTQTVSQPGAASLSCLSCHDGQTAIDSIINMPGPGKYRAEQAFSQDKDFLNTWTTVGQGGGGPPGAGAGTDDHHNTMVQCEACHSGSLVPFATSFQSFVIGTDLRNDHPVGINFPTSSADFNAPGGTTTGNKFFDTNSNTRMDKEDIRLFKNGADYRVECASCHDPHGVPSAGAGTAFNKTFLRKTNDNSQVCLTCHNK